MESKLSLNLIKSWQALCSEIVFTDVAPLLLQKRVITVEEYRHIVSQNEDTAMENFLLLLLKKNDEILLKFGECLEKDYSWLAEKLKEGYSKDEGRDEIDASPITRIDPEENIENERAPQDIYKDCHNVNSISRNQYHLNRVYNKYRNLEKRRVINSRVKNRLKPKIHNPDPVVTSTTELIKPVLNEEVTDEVITIIRRSSLISKSWTTLAHSLGLTDRVNDIRYKVVLHGEDLSMCVVYLIKDWLETYSKIATLSKLIEVLRSENFNGVADNLTEILHRKSNIAAVKVQ